MSFNLTSPLCWQLKCYDNYLFIKIIFIDKLYKEIFLYYNKKNNFYGIKFITTISYTWYSIK